MATFCANINCVKHTEDRGGRFKFDPADKQYYCDECFAVRRSPTCVNLWDFVTSHGDGVRTHIRSLSELRAYEKRTGTSNQLANNREANCQ